MSHVMLGLNSFLISISPIKTFINRSILYSSNARTIINKCENSVESIFNRSPHRGLEYQFCSEGNHTIITFTVLIFLQLQANYNLTTK